MKIVVCFPHINSYMAACWRALLERDGIDIHVFGFRSGTRNYPVAFADSVLAGLEHRLFDEEEISDPKLVASLVAEQKPEALIVSGWEHECYRSLAYDRRLAEARRIMLMDNPRKGTWKQSIGRWLLRPYLRRMDYVFVTGERSWQCARYLGVPEAKVRRGCCGIDYAMLDKAYRSRLAETGRPNPTGFLFAGRYVEAKGIDLMLEGYSRYRATVPDPWPLRCCGMGPMASMLAGQTGVHDLGFVQPHDVYRLFGEHAAFVLFSRFDAWPLVILEASAAGMPVLCSEACGSSVEMVRSFHNGLQVPTGDVDAIAHSMSWLHANSQRIPQMGARGNQLASAYSAQMWAERVCSMLNVPTASKGAISDSPRISMACSPEIEPT